LAIDRSAPKNLPGWVRTLEWALVAGVIVVLMMVFLRQVRMVQGQAERASIQATLGALRAALVIDFVHGTAAAATPSVTLPQRNPFELLAQRPANYFGEFKASASDAPPAGSWVFDPACACVGYAPLDPQWFDSPSGNLMAWFQLGGAPGPLQLTAKEAYVWQSEALR
jgi:hypothetical protein